MLKDPRLGGTEMPKKNRPIFLAFGSGSRHHIFVTNDPFGMFRPAKSSYGLSSFISGVYGWCGCPLDTLINDCSGSRFGPIWPDRVKSPSHAGGVL